MKAGSCAARCGIKHSLTCFAKFAYAVITTVVVVVFSTYLIRLFQEKNLKEKK